MKRCALLPCVLLAACVAPPAVDRAPAVVTEPTPVCTGKTHCERMWVAAQEMIQRYSGMRIRLLTDSRIETFAATRVPSLTGLVTKIPTGKPDQYEIVGQLECSRDWCIDQKAKGENAFNAMVGLIRP